MARLQSTRRRAFAAIAVFALANGIAGCSHNDDDDRDHGQPPVAGSPNPPTATDSFVTYVAQLLGTPDETSEPASTDGVAVTTPEGTAPQPVSGS